MATKEKKIRQGRFRIPEDEKIKRMSICLSPEERGKLRKIDASPTKAVRKLLESK